MDIVMLTLKCQEPLAEAQHVVFVFAAGEIVAAAEG
jgi:hypothetical protein